MAEQPRRNRWTRLLRDLTPPGAVRALQRASHALTTEQQTPESRLPVPVEPPDEARERARRALLEARQAMGGLLGEAPSTPAPSIPSELDISRRLDEAAAERRRISETVEGVRAKVGDIDDAVLAVLSAVEALERRLDKLEGAIAAISTRPDPVPAHPTTPPNTPDAAAATAAEPVTPPAPEAPEAILAEVATGTPAANVRPDTSPAPSSSGITASAPPQADTPPPATPSPAPAAVSGSVETPAPASETPPPSSEGTAVTRTTGATEDERRALHSRVFPAGTIATRVRFHPVPPDFASLIARIATDPNVEHIEVIDADPDAPVLAISFRLAQRWPQMSGLLERALGAPLTENQAGWSNGTITVRPPDSR